MLGKLTGLCALLSGLVLAAPQAGPRPLTIPTAERERQCTIHVPSRCTGEQTWPLVLVFHGGGGTAQSAIDEGGWIEKADREGFLLAVPEGTPRHPGRKPRFAGNPQTWNDGSARTGLGAVAQGIDDVAFVNTLLDTLIARYPVDPQRIYSTGFSNGASMCFRLARELSTRFAAAAPVAGADWMAQTIPERAVPILYITGTADPLNPFSGGDVRIGRKFYGIKPATPEMIQVWADYHRGGPAPENTNGPTGAKRTAYCRPDGTEAVVCLALPGHGHHWPGGSSKLPRWLAGKNSSTLNATDVIWNFFRTRHLGDR